MSGRGGKRSACAQANAQRMLSLVIPWNTERYRFEHPPSSIRLERTPAQCRGRLEPAATRSDRREHARRRAFTRVGMPRERSAPTKSRPRRFWLSHGSPGDRDRAGRPASVAVLLYLPATAFRPSSSSIQRLSVPRSKSNGLPILEVAGGGHRHAVAVRASRRRSKTPRRGGANRLTTIRNGWSSTTSLMT